ncbi:MAG: GNAT family N-acetyltransferase [Chloroflexi bacterium]|nr:GNAT family N-acetyltransferase [Chloroflexota bacterium]
MLSQIPSHTYDKTRPLFAYSQLLVIESMLAGLTLADIYVDDVSSPQTAVTWFKDRVIIGGQPGSSQLRQAIRHLLATTFTDQAKGIGADEFSVYAPPVWQPHLAAVMPGEHPLPDTRVYYRLDARGRTWQTVVPAGYKLRRVDAALLADASIHNLDYVTDEMCSERPSVADFLDKSFGYCVVQAGAIVAWCMSEYNSGNRCELGIETADSHRRQGLASVTATAVIQEAVSRGMYDIGWLSWASNTPSLRIAEKLGFHKTAEYPIRFMMFDPVVNLAVNGYFRHEAGEFAEALVWYRQALAEASAPDWIAYRAARAAATLGQTEDVFVYLETAVAKGFNDKSYLQQQPEFEPYHHLPDWVRLQQKLQRRQDTSSFSSEV